MKNYNAKIWVLACLLPTTLAAGSNKGVATSPTRVDCKKLSIDAFSNLQKSESDEDLNSQVEDLERKGFKKNSTQSEAITLSSSSGTAGRNQTMLVTTSFEFTAGKIEGVEESGVNPQTKVIVAVVSCFAGRKSVVNRVLSEKELSELRRTK